MAVAALAGAMAQALAPGVRAGAPPAPAPEQVVQAAWQAVADHYFDSTYGGVDWQRARATYLRRAAEPGADGYALASEMVALLKDPGTYVLRPQQRAKLDEEERRLRVDVVGIGVLLSAGPGGTPMVRQVLPGGPAQQAGVRQGMLVLEVDGQDVRKLSITQVADRIRGAAGTTVRLVVMAPGGARQALTLTRRAVSSAPQPSGRLLQGENIGYIYLPHFHEGMETAFLAELRKLIRTRALILDLRTSFSGGSLGTLSHIAGLLAEGQALGILTSREEVFPLPAVKAESSSNPLVPAPTAIDAYAKPVAVLIDESTTFGILAFALQEMGRAVLVGRPTQPATGDTQQRWELPGGGLIQVTSGRFFSSRGRPLVGPVVPDVTVPMDDEWLRAWYDGSDLDVRRAIQALRQRGAI